MSEEEIANLINPYPENFSPELWAAVAYAREWAITQGNVEDAAIIENYEKHYDPKERGSIEAIIFIMNFANKFSNVWEKPVESCTRPN